MNDLESCHIRAARMINKVPKTVKNEDVLKTVKWRDSNICTKGDLPAFRTKYIITMQSKRSKACSKRKITHEI